jgi:hypothetical protein
MAATLRAGATMPIAGIRVIDAVPVELGLA